VAKKLAEFLKGGGVPQDPIKPLNFKAPRRKPKKD
jgi:hypothetical protein